jgi:sterol desaturase/sphingolipid hydroxylase (fatty acid hydroxylase superfamily)
MELARPVRPVLTYATYPLLAMMTGAGVWLTLSRNLERNAVIGVLTVVTVAIAFAVERINPLLDRWRMTKDSFVGRDLPFIGLGFVVEQAATMGVSLVAAATVTTGGFGPLAELPLPVQAVVALLALDLLWYAYHRAAHTFSRLWRVHGVHHSPSQLYVLMHPVFHPLDLLVSRFAIALIASRRSLSITVAPTVRYPCPVSAAAFALGRRQFERHAIKRPRRRRCGGGGAAGSPGHRSRW